MVKKKNKSEDRISNVHKQVHIYRMDRVADIGESTENLSNSSHDSDSLSVASDMSNFTQSSVLDDAKLREIEELRVNKYFSSLRKTT